MTIYALSSGAGVSGIAVIRISGKDTFKISIEASSQSGWKHVVGKDGVTLGLSTFGKSAPYKDIYKLFNLTSDEIVKIVKAKVKK